MSRDVNQAVTIYDIAREAGVSPSTVSRVLSGSVNVSKSRREKVLELVEKYNFSPSALAQGLSDARSHTIGILMSDVRNPYYADLFVACEEAAYSLGYTMLLGNTLSDKRVEIRQLEKLRAQRVDAVIQVGGCADDLDTDPEYARLVNRLMRCTPMVVAGKLDGTSCYRVSIDHRRSMELIMEHLISLGHRDIALVGGRRNVTSTNEKLRCYREKLEEHGIPFREELVASDGGYGPDTGLARMDAMLDVGICPTAVVAVNDFTAFGVRRSILEHGLRIPKDVSLASYDNTSMTELMIPPLTSIDYRYASYGRLLVETAVKAIGGEELPPVQWIEPELVVRGTTGPAPK